MLAEATLVLTAGHCPSDQDEGRGCRVEMGGESCAGRKPPQAQRIRVRALTFLSFC